MIRKLKRRFIWVSAISVFFVLLVTIAAINISNAIGIENDASSNLDEIVRVGPSSEQAPGGPRDGGQDKLKQQHYFVVSFDSSGAIQETDNRQMFILTKAECEELATKVFRDELTGGKYGDFRYRKALNGNGLTYVGFLDIKEPLESFQRFLLVSSLVSLGAYGVLVGLIVVASNIAFRPSEEAYRKQKRFITNASHELKTPITVISADLDLIEMDYGKSEWSESIRDQLTRLTEMTNELVTLSRLEEDDPSRFPFEDFSLSEVFADAAASFTPLFEKEGIKFSYNIHGNPTMHGNKKLIDELIHVFLDNSLRYTGGDKKASYFVVSENAKGKIEMRFSNTLDKSDEVDVRQIMDRFYRSPSNKKEGSGVGLSIAQEIIDLHKGKITAERNDSTISFLITL